MIKYDEINKSLRISLTEKCNYKCFFCHEEGLNMQKKRNSENKEKIYEIIKIGLKKGYRDLTFTGGEPLLKLKDIIWYLENLEKEKMYPDITIVTNGYLITEELLNKIEEYKGKFKFNISLHSLNENDYMKIINIPKNTRKPYFETVNNNIKEVVKRKIEIKLNFVLLKGINTEKSKIKEILEYGVNNSINYIKFLELLVIDGKEEIYNYFTEIEEIEEVWGNELTLIDENILRRKVYNYKNKLKVELQKCTCSFGCKSCLKNRDVNITSELKYYPCFILSNENYDINNENFEIKINKGNDKIRKYANKYKEDSPILVKKSKYIKEKIENYYITEIIEKDKIKKLLEENDFSLYRTLSTTERYYNFSDNKSNKIIKLFIHSHNEATYKEVIQKYIIDEKKDEIKIRFLNLEPPKIEKEKLIEYEKKLEKEKVYYDRTLEWDIKIYKNKKKLEEISVGIEKNSNLIFILSYDKKIKNKIILDKLKLKKILKLPIEFIRNNCEK